jgi:adenylate cyclase
MKVGPMMTERALEELLLGGARLTAVAYPGTVLVDTRLSAAVAGVYETVALRSRPLQGLGRVRPWAVRRPARPI